MTDESLRERTNPDHHHSRDPEDRAVAPGDRAATREKNMDKTIADSFPSSDPQSSLPNPAGDES